MGNQYRSYGTGREAMEESIRIYEDYLYERERYPNTVKKYVRDVRAFFRFVQSRKKAEPKSMESAPEFRELKREWVLRYKEHLTEVYKASSINSMLAALNGYLRFIGREGCCVGLCRIQQQIFREEERELSREEYQRLVIRAEREGNLRLGCILQTIGSTGIRIGELSYITVETLERRMVWIRSKGKERCILLPRSLVTLLRKYCRKKQIQSGSIFITRSGRPVDRRNIWAEMKRLCRTAGVLEKKGFPHNLRHLFARTYYEKEKDIVRLADYLGHSNVETTRRYTRVSSMGACLRQLEMGMLVEGYLDGRHRKNDRCVFPGKRAQEQGGRIKTAMT